MLACHLDINVGIVNLCRVAFLHQDLVARKHGFSCFSLKRFVLHHNHVNPVAIGAGILYTQYLQRFGLLAMAQILHGVQGNQTVQRGFCSLHLRLCQLALVHRAVQAGNVACVAHQVNINCIPCDHLISQHLGLVQVVILDLGGGARQLPLKRINLRSQSHLVSQQVFHLLGVIFPQQHMRPCPQEGVGDRFLAF